MDHLELIIFIDIICFLWTSQTDIYFVYPEEKYHLNLPVLKQKEMA